MAQHDYVIANQSGAAFRADLNNALAAIVSQNSGGSEPSTTYAYQLWADNTNGLLKLRDASNSSWITLRSLDATGRIDLPVGTTAQRPASPSAGMLRFNSTLTRVEAYDGSGWVDQTGFDSGTVMLFQQTAAPTGWTKLTTHNNKALRVVSGAASSGGTSAFTTVFASRTPAGTVSGSNSGGSVSATTLTTSQIPSHSHSYSYRTEASGGTTGSGTVWKGTTTATSGAEGGGSSHDHGFSNPSWSGSFSGTAMDFAVQYVDVIFASKD